MALRLDRLVKLSNLSPQVREDALRNLDKLNGDQKARLSQICWESIASTYENKARLEYERMVEDMADGKNKYGPNDFNAIDGKIISDLLLKLDSAETKDEIERVKRDLESLTKKT